MVIFRPHCITLDEWTNVSMKRFVNINLEDNEFKTYNLGLEYMGHVLRPL